MHQKSIYQSIRANNPINVLTFTTIQTLDLFPGLSLGVEALSGS